MAQFDLWIAVHPEDRRLATALNGRCWARALAGRDLEKALSDCNTAVRLSQRAADVLDSRGLVHFRRGEFSRAIADYDAALAQKPKIAWSLYGRGLAELKTGAKAQGDADLAAAATEAPNLAARAARRGLSPGPRYARRGSGLLDDQADGGDVVLLDLQPQVGLAAAVEGRRSTTVSANPSPRPVHGRGAVASGANRRAAASPPPA